MSLPTSVFPLSQNTTNGVDTVALNTDQEHWSKTVANEKSSRFRIILKVCDRDCFPSINALTILNRQWEICVALPNCNNNGNQYIAFTNWPQINRSQNVVKIFCGGRGGDTLALTIRFPFFVSYNNWCSLLR